MSVQGDQWGRRRGGPEVGQISDAPLATTGGLADAAHHLALDFLHQQGLPRAQVLLVAGEMEWDGREVGRFDDMAAAGTTAAAAGSTAVTAIAGTTGATATTGTAPIAATTSTTGRIILCAGTTRTNRRGGGFGPFLDHDIRKEPPVDQQLAHALQGIVVELSGRCGKVHGVGR